MKIEIEDPFPDDTRQASVAYLRRMARETKTEAYTASRWLAAIADAIEAVNPPLEVGEEVTVSGRPGTIEHIKDDRVWVVWQDGGHWFGRLALLERA